MNKTKRHRKLNKFKIATVIFILIIIVTLSVFGRYVYNGIREAYFTSRKFYFTSNLLTLNNPTYQYEDWGGVDTYNISFDLYSYANTLSRMEYDLDYSVSCETPDADKVTLRY